MGYLWRFLDQLADSVFDPIIKWLLSSSWWWRFTALLAVLVIIIVINTPPDIARWFQIVEDFSALRNANSLTAELPTRDQTRLDHTIATFSSALFDKLGEKGPTPPVNPWTSADIVVSLLNDQPVDSDDYERYIKLYEVTKDCFCWSEYPGPGNPPQLGMQSWVLMTLTRLKLPNSSTPAAHFLVRNQKPDGWWSVYPSDVKDHNGNASTYATAIAVLALENYKEGNMLHGDNKDQIDRAIDAGVEWLRRHQITSRARWEDYPEASNGKESISLSALTLHVLHRLDRYYDPELSTEWLEELPVQLPPTALASDSAAHPIYLDNNQMAKDSVRYLIVQWEIIATADAFSEGTIMEKANALDWFANALKVIQNQAPSLDDEPWAAAESLIALRYVRDDKAL
jgi:hypothetical protein